MKKLVFAILILTTLFISFCSSEKTLVRKASNAVESSDYDKAIAYYDEVLAKDSNSYYATAGKGIVLSEYKEKHREAIPYLEKALKNSPKKNLTKIYADLGKDYHFIGNYERALYYYNQSLEAGVGGDPDYDAFISKRIADCKYAIEHPEVASPEMASVENIGGPVNTSMPEYGPVYVNNKTLYFTSKRQDSPKEKKNGIDGRYFENIYVAHSNSPTFSAPARYTVPGTKEPPKFNRNNESLLSVSSDGKKLFVYRKGRIFEVDANDPSANPEKLDVGSAQAQTHAYISPDNKTLFFAAQAENSQSGTDIFQSVKDNDGNWSEPVAISAINTSYNEEAPFLSENGTLFFSSNGLPGYGGFDVYRSKFENGVWSAPQNLGQPINSPADDIYFTLKPNSANGFFSSGRVGGHGDMDIYRVHYVAPEVENCRPDMTPLAINADLKDSASILYSFMAIVPETYAGKVKSFTWKVNNNVISPNSQNMDYAFTTPGTYTVSAITTIYCDTCPSLMAVCAEKVIATAPDNAPNTAPAVSTSVAGNTTDEVETGTKTKKGTKTGKAGTEKTGEDLISSLNWNANPAHFEYNSMELTEESKKHLDQSIETLKNNTNLSITITGYADSRGSAAYNKSLSLKRANSVKEYFIKNGIPQKRIKGVYGLGETSLVNNCKDDIECTEEQHQANRRTEVKVFLKGSHEITIKRKRAKKPNEG